MMVPALDVTWLDAELDPGEALAPLADARTAATPSGAARSTTSSASCTCASSAGEARGPTPQPTVEDARPGGGRSCPRRRISVSSSATCASSAQQIAIVVDEYGGGRRARHARGRARGDRRRDRGRVRPARQLDRAARGRAPCASTGSMTARRLQRDRRATRCRRTARTRSRASSSTRSATGPAPGEAGRHRRRARARRPGGRRRAHHRPARDVAGARPPGRLLATCERFTCRRRHPLLPARGLRVRRPRARPRAARATADDVTLVVGHARPGLAPTRARFYAGLRRARGALRPRRRAGAPVLRGPPRRARAASSPRSTTTPTERQVVAWARRAARRRAPPAPTSCTCTT